MLTKAFSIITEIIKSLEMIQKGSRSAETGQDEILEIEFHVKFI